MSKFWWDARMSALLFLHRVGLPKLAALVFIVRPTREPSATVYEKVEGRLTLDVERKTND